MDPPQANWSQPFVYQYQYAQNEMFQQHMQHAPSAFLPPDAPPYYYYGYHAPGFAPPFPPQPNSMMYHPGQQVNNMSAYQYHQYPSWHPSLSSAGGGSAGSLASSGRSDDRRKSRKNNVREKKLQVASVEVHACYDADGMTLQQIKGEYFRL